MIKLSGLGVENTIILQKIKSNDKKIEDLSAKLTYYAEKSNWVKTISEVHYCEGRVRKFTKIIDQLKDRREMLKLLLINNNYRKRRVRDDAEDKHKHEGLVVIENTSSM